MFEYFKGEITELTISYIVLEINNIGYLLNISMTTYSELKDKKEVKLYIHQVIKEDSNKIFGFYTKLEREVFLRLITVSGIGANTARLYLSSMTPHQIISAILSEDSQSLTSVKGVGLKTAKRTIIELKDKFNNIDNVETGHINIVSRVEQEAITALELLGFAKKQAEKVVKKIIASETDISVEGLIKKALKSL